MSVAKKIVNLTPHDVHVFLATGDAAVVFPKSGRVARLLSAPQRTLRTLDCGVEVWTPQTFVGFEDHGLSPLGKRDNAGKSHSSFGDDVDGVIVSMPVGEFLRAQRLAERHPAWWDVSVYGPDMGPDAAVRDEKGVILGTRRLVQYL